MSDISGSPEGQDVVTRVLLSLTEEEVLSRNDSFEELLPKINGLMKWWANQAAYKVPSVVYDADYFYSKIVEYILYALSTYDPARGTLMGYIRRVVWTCTDIEIGSLYTQKRTPYVQLTGGDNYDDVPANPRLSIDKGGVTVRRGSGKRLYTLLSVISYNAPISAHNGEDSLSSLEDFISSSQEVAEEVVFWEAIDEVVDRLLGDSREEGKIALCILQQAIEPETEGWRTAFELTNREIRIARFLNVSSGLVRQAFSLLEEALRIHFNLPEGPKTLLGIKKSDFILQLLQESKEGLSTLDLGKQFVAAGFHRGISRRELDNIACHISELRKLHTIVLEKGKYRCKNSTHTF